MVESVNRVTNKMTISKSDMIEPNCRLCDDFGFIETELGTMECQCVINRREENRIEKLFESAKIPKRYQNKTLANFEADLQPKAFEIAVQYTKTWPKENGESLFFVGPVGTGKTHLARSILATMIKEHGISGLATTVPNLMDELRPAGTADHSPEKITILKTVPLLVLDDLGAQKNTDWVTERLFIVINARYDDLLPTVITSNIMLEDLRKIIGWDRLSDRIIEMARPVKMTGLSYRVKDKIK